MTVTGDARRAVRVAAAVLCTLALLSAPVHAEDERTLEAPDWSSYLVDGGAVPFLYAPLAVAMGLRFLAEPVSTPVLFSEDEGGKVFDGDTVPNWVVGTYNIAGLALVALAPGDGRWHHTKGYAQAVTTTLALTEIAKNAFGRHRPHFQPGSNDEDDRRSFFSGHSSMTFVTTTYLSLYLNRHVFSRWRPKGKEFALWELAPYAALYGGSVFVVASRVQDNRHHLSDVVTGTLVGTATAGVFYWWQQKRYRRAKTELIVAPRHVGVRMRF